MKKRYRYVLLETASQSKEFYYCLSDGLIYERLTSFGKSGRNPYLTFLVCTPIGFLMGFIILALYASTSSSIIWLYIGFLVLAICVLVCVNDYVGRQKRLNLARSQKTLSDFGSYLPLIRDFYRKQKKLVIICPLLLVLFLSYMGEAPVPCLVFFSFFALVFYYSIFRVGVLDKKKVIALIQNIDNMHKENDGESQ